MLLRGPSGVGKSDLALRAVQAGWRLAADDRVVVWRSGARAFGRAAPPLHGLMEARGQAILRLPALALAPVDLVAELLAPGDPIERLPDAGCVDVAGVAVRRVRLCGGEASALARLGFALQANDSPAATAPL